MKSETLFLKSFLKVEFFFLFRQNWKLTGAIKCCFSQAKSFGIFSAKEKTEKSYPDKRNKPGEQEEQMLEICKENGSKIKNLLNE